MHATTTATSSRARPRMRLLRVALALLFSMQATLAIDAHADPPSGAGSATTDSLPDAEAVSTRRTEALAELSALGDEIGTIASTERRSDLEEVRGRLRRVVRLLDEQSELLSVPPPTARASAPSPEIDLELPSPFALNALHELQYASARQEEIAEQALDTRRRLLAAAKEKLALAEAALRESLRTGTPSGVGHAEEQLSRLRNLDVRIAQEEVKLRTLEVRAAEKGKATAQGAESLETHIEAMRKRLEEGQGDSAAGFDLLARREQELRSAHATAERAHAIAEQRLHAGTDAGPAAEALINTRDHTRDQISLIEERLERTIAARELWERWDAFYRRKGSATERQSWTSETEARVDMLRDLEQRRLERATELELEMQSLAGPGKTGPEPDERAASEHRQAELARAHATQLSEARSIARDRRAHERFLGDLQGITGRLDLPNLMARTGRSARDAWSYEITSVDDAPITVGSLALALALFALGLWASRRGSSAVARLTETRLELDPGAAHALETVSFYILLASFTLLALRAVHFPLTAFTVLGGALAIGVGFGSQNVMNNFISGLILMLERPVRARDVVEVDGNHGTIEKIGARSTQIRSMDGRHIVVPNSFFLESNVVNWTLSDQLVRAKVAVGVAYGSPTRRVEELIQQAVGEDDRVLPSPAPIIVFHEFGSNSLNFDTYFWVNARSPMAIWQVASRIRFRIDELFRDHEIVIAFPQRDVHVDTLPPLDVRILQAKDN